MKKNFLSSFKNLKRLTQIINVFARYGFRSEIEESSLGDFLDTDQVKEEPTSQERLGQRLAGAFEELGPTFIKLGQILSSRGDLLSEEICGEFERLQNRIKPLPMSRLFRSKKLKEFQSEFLSIENEPIGAASIGQVHRATLLDDQQVVIKVKKPNLEKLIRVDLEILFSLSDLLEKHLFYFKNLNLKFILEELKDSLEKELDYHREAYLTEKIGYLLNPKKDLFRVPKVYSAYSNEEVICLEYVDGLKPSQDWLPPEEGEGLAHVVLQSYFHLFFKTGFVHGDLHLGNLIYDEQSKELFCLDFGMVIQLTRHYRTIFQFFFWAISRENFESAARILLELVDASHLGASEGLEKDVRHILEKLSYQKDQSLGEVLMSSLTLISNYHLKVKPDISLLCKSFMVLENTLKSLDPQFQIFLAIETYYRSELKFESLTWVKDEFPIFFQDLFFTARELPRAFRSLIQNLSSPSIRIEQTSEDLSDFSHQFEKTFKKFMLSCLLGFVFLGNAVIAFFLKEDFHFLGAFFFVLGSTIGVFFLFKIFLKI